jgi:hypothetical protein
MIVRRSPGHGLRVVGALMDGPNANVMAPLGKVEGNDRG